VLVTLASRNEERDTALDRASVITDLEITQSGRVASGIQLGLKIQSDSAPPPLQTLQR
jgi:hypothetical protein